MGLKCSDSPDSCFREHGENKFNQNIYISWKKQKTLHSIQEPVGRNNTHIMVNLQTPWNLIIVNLFIARHHSLKPIAVIQNINSSPNAVKWEVYEPTQCKEVVQMYFCKEKLRIVVERREVALLQFKGVFYYQVLSVLKLPPPDPFLPISPDCLKLFFYECLIYIATCIWE